MSSLIGSKRKRQEAAAAAECPSESEPSDSDSDCSEGEDESEDDSEEDEEEDESNMGDDSEEEGEEEDVKELPRNLFLYGWNALNAAEWGKYAKAKTAFEKSIAILLSLEEDLRQLYAKISSRKNKHDGKVPPGSGNVQRTIEDDRFLLCQCKVGISRIYIHAMNERVDVNMQRAVEELQEAVLWYPKSVEAHCQLAQLLKFQCTTVAQLERVEHHYKKAAQVVVEAASGAGGGSSSSSKDDDAAIAAAVAHATATATAADSSATAASTSCCDESAGCDRTDVDHVLLLKEREHSRTAREQLSLLYLQYYNNGGGKLSEVVRHDPARVEEAAGMLSKCGFRYRLSDAVLCYAREQRRSNGTNGDSSGVDDGKEDESLSYIRTQDGMLPQFMLEHLQHVFRPAAPYWTEHDYDAFIGNHSKSVGYFSYVYPLRHKNAAIAASASEKNNDSNDSGSSGSRAEAPRTDACCSIEQIIDVIYDYVAEQFPEVAKECTLAEWWVHTRPYCNGHQLHFDSDETNTADGRPPQHPMLTAIIYCTPQGTEAEVQLGGAGGPTLITNQVLSASMPSDEAGADAKSQERPGFSSLGQSPQLLATKGWLCHPKYNRCIVMDAKYLHGVVPGKRFFEETERGSHAAAASSAKGEASGSPSGTVRRLTFMVGFWKSICARDRGEGKPGPGQHFPSARGRLAAETSASSAAVAAPTTCSVAAREYTWPAEMKRFSADYIAIQMAEHNKARKKLINEGSKRQKNTAVVPVAPIWQPVHASASSSTAATTTNPLLVPSYRNCFQGF